MLTRDDLEQIGKVVEDKVKAETELIKKQLDTVEMKVEAVNTKLDKAYSDLAEMDKQILFAVGEHVDKLEKRVEIIEGQLDLNQ